MTLWDDLTPEPALPVRIIGRAPERVLPLCGLDPTAPFSAAMAREAGLSPAHLTAMCRAGELVRLFKGVYVVGGIPDSVPLRLSAVRLVTPPELVACDDTAAWLHGVDLMPPGSHLGVPPLRVFALPEDGRLRIPGVTSGARALRESDIVTLDRVRVTSALRTAWDLGRVRNLARGLGNVDGMLRTGKFSRGELLAGVERFKGERWVTHLRVLAPLADPRAESLPESMLRWHWMSSGLPWPEPQLPVLDDLGVARYRLDLADEVNRVAAEYDGALFHGPERRQHDDDRRAWIEAHRGILIAVFTDRDLFGLRADPLPKLFALYRRRTGRSW